MKHTVKSWGKHASSVTSICLTLLLVFVLFSAAHSASFSVSPIENTLGISVMEVEGNYDGMLPDGTLNSPPREEIAKIFFATHPDKYDFIAIFSNFDFLMPHEEAAAFYTAVKNDVSGIGLDIFDNSDLYGSDGKLQGTIDMGNLYAKSIDPLSPEFSETMYVLSHELLHRWAAQVEFKDSNGEIRNDLVGRDGDHWSFLLDTDGSVVYGNQWIKNGDGTFTSLPGRKYFSQLDLYLMGFADKSEVPPMLLIQNPEVDKNRVQEAGVTIAGKPQYITIDDIISAEGERVPNFQDSQKAFKIGVIYLARPGTYVKEDLYAIRNIINNWQVWFSGLTDGIGKIVTENDVVANVPENQGPAVPYVDPRSVPPEINDGVTWLINHRLSDGSWQDSNITHLRDTTTALDALQSFTIADEASAVGFQWLTSTSPNSVDYLARKIEALSREGQDVSQLDIELYTKQNRDGGWGDSGSYVSNPTDTALALEALTKSGFTNQGTIGRAVEYLKETQNSDGGWGGNGQGSDIQSTFNVLSAFAGIQDDTLESNIAKAGLWLLTKQNNDGGFGNSSSTVYDTAYAIMALRELDSSEWVLTPALSYILNLQSADGSWYGSSFQTALAVQAVWESKSKADLSISTANIKASPLTFTSLPSEINLSASIENLGLTAAQDVKVVLYDGVEVEANKIDGQIVDLDGESSATVSFTPVINDGQIHRYYFVVDPADEIQESSESNNKALVSIYPEPTLDFAINQADVALTGTEFEMFQDVNISVNIKNSGTRDAEGVPLSLYLETAGGPHSIGIKNLSIKAGQSTSAEFTWRADVSGENLTLTAEVDPANSFSELSEENNKVQNPISVNPSTKPNPAVLSGEIHLSPSPALEAGAAEISAIIGNNGFAQANDVTVDFFLGVPGAGGELLGETIISSLEAGNEVQAVFDWATVHVSGKQIITVVADSENRIDEIDENDNSGFIVAEILTLPDLEINNASVSLNPAFPHEGEPITITVTVVNGGGQDAFNVPITIIADGVELVTKSIEKIDGKSQVSASFEIDTANMAGVVTLEVVADGDDEILEGNENNNETSRIIGFQNADLWLSERYISPNGDGVQDVTNFFYRLEFLLNVNVVVVNDTNEIVRTFQGTEHQETTGGVITWDGRSDLGKIVVDGDYSIQIRQNGTILNRLVVTVDNNRSSLSDAIGTKYIYVKKIDRDKLGGVAASSYQMIPDGSGMLWTIQSENIGDEHQYQDGLYISDPYGENLKRIVPLEWGNSKDNNQIYLYHDVSISQESRFISFDLAIYELLNGGEYGDKKKSEAWVFDRENNQLNIIDSIDYQANELSNSRYETIIPFDNKTILCLKRINGNRILKLINISSNKIDTIYEKNFEHANNSGCSAKWSLNNKVLAVAIYAGVEGSQLLIVNRNGEELYYRNGIDGYDWMDDEKLLVEIYDKLLIYDVANNYYLGRVYSDIYKSSNFSWIVSPDKKHFVAGQSYCDSELNCKNIFEDLYHIGEYMYLYGDYSFSADGKFYADASRQRVSSNNTIPDAHIEIDFESGNINIYPAGNIKSWCNPLFDNIPSNYSVEWLFPEDPCDMQQDLHLTWDTQHLGKYILGLYKNAYGIVYDPVSGRPLAPISKGILIDQKNSVVRYDPFSFGNEIPDYGLYIPMKPMIYISPSNNYINLSLSYIDVADNQFKRIFESYGSLDNLTVDILPLYDDVSIIIRGTVVDKHISYFTLEYAFEDNPEEWRFIQPPSDQSVVDDVIADWVPPKSGRYLIRLTAYDKAGNVSVARCRVSWDLERPVVNMYKDNEYFSPNNDGIQDEGVLYYTTLEPISLQFNIYDQNDALIKTIVQEHSLPGDQRLSWDGSDSQDRIVADGVYRINFNRYDFYFEVDNSSPRSLIEFADARINPGLDSDIHVKSFHPCAG
jgi:subtilase family serine protease/flagellar hook assembly protein FlgD